MKHEIVLSIYMTVEADTEDEALEKANEMADELFDMDVVALDSKEGFTVDNWFCDWTAA